MDKREEIQKILIDFSEGDIWINEATDDILALFDVVGRSEQLYRNTKLKSREAIKIDFIEEVYECDSGQSDNVKDEGALAEKLYLAKRFIEEELPKRD